MCPKQKKDKTEGATGLGRITRGQIERWNQTTAFSFQTGGDIRRALPPFGPNEGKEAEYNFAQVR